MSLENLSGSLFENFEEDELNNSAAIIAGWTFRGRDCDPTDGTTKWGVDSTRRQEDGCNDFIVGSSGSIGSLSTATTRETFSFTLSEPSFISRKLLMKLF